MLLNIYFQNKNFYSKKLPHESGFFNGYDANAV